MYRRKFLKTLALGTAAAGFAPSILSTNARAAADTPAKRLAVTSRVLEVNGKPAKVFGLAQPDGTPGLTFDAGTDFDVLLANETAEPTLIHWHGLTPPWTMDGVPDNPAALMTPAETRRYTFPAGSGGTHWMHAHTLQEQNLLAAPLIVRRPEEAASDEQEVVILLHDFSFRSPEELFDELKGGKGHGAAQMGGMSMGGMSGMGHMGHDMGGSMGGGSMGGQQGMAMPGMGGMAGMDLNDIEYDAYLANDRTLDDPQVVQVEKGGRVRLRIINGATSTAFTIDTGEVLGRLVAVDGQPVQPIAGTRFPASMGQRLDIVVELPKEGGAFPILALREGSTKRTGLVLASAGAAIGKLAGDGEETGPALDLGLEQRLRAVTPLDKRPPARSYRMVLGGDMASYTWSIAGAEALAVGTGERIRFVVQNMSMMAHPMHLHGHHFQVTAVNGVAIAGAVRDTVLLPPMAEVALEFDANNAGRWPFHCHHLYHMASGMMAFVAYGNA
ncbi:secreted protein [Ciceribacter lividus]|uniref:Secreted protein n=1 Tax=Ciceribacter lividus TaxID=1197950 RepID=A0A6I7HSV8_9HYPH|nr:multicopper oxidase domain-containing protein [Ciceribacter lividus]RCW27956.1 secreted protein [Ciceribacter lividus]